MFIIGFVLGVLGTHWYYNKNNNNNDKPENHYL